MLFWSKHDEMAHHVWLVSFLGASIFTYPSPIIRVILICFPILGGGSDIVNYVLVKECDASLVNTIKIGLLLLGLADHKPLYLHIATKDTLCDLAIKGDLNVNRVESSITNPSLSKDVKLYQTSNLARLISKCSS